MGAGRYDPITVQQGIPVKWTLNAPNGTLNGCNSSIVIPEYNIQLKLKAGENLIEFTPDKAGTFSFSCWMGMIRSAISVTDTDGIIPPAQDDGSAGLPSGGCCGAGFAPDFANGKIPTDSIQIAEVVNGVQQATVKVDSYGYSPAVIVIERGKKFVINFDAVEINGCNSVVYFPDYGGGLD
jgi:plastocyanin domain-containing protein